MTTATLAPESVGLTRDEYEEIRRRLGRDPSQLELQMFGVMWSEHCGYKHSKVTVELLPAESPHLLQGPGENAGVLAIGGAWAGAFKTGSHNHPSAEAPVNGAATVVARIIRDVVSLRAPVATASVGRRLPQKNSIPGPSARTGPRCRSAIRSRANS